MAWGGSPSSQPAHRFKKRLILVITTNDIVVFVKCYSCYQ